MADVIRDPLYIARREIPPMFAGGAGVFAAGSLLVTTLATAPLPVGAKSFPLQDERPGQRLSLNQSTAAGSPKTLRLELQQPVGARVFPLQEQRPNSRFSLNQDESCATPKTLTVDKQLPIGGAGPFFASNSHRIREIFSWDTTQDSPQTVRPDAQTPIGKGQTYSPPDRVRPVWDESAGTPKQLYDDAQLPVGDSSNVVTPAPRPNVVDSSQPAYAAAQPPAVLLPPIVPTVYLAVVDWRELGPDTSAETPKTLIEEPAPPTDGGSRRRRPATLRPLAREPQSFEFQPLELPESTAIVQADSIKPTSAAFGWTIVTDESEIVRLKRISDTIDAIDALDRADQLDRMNRK
jgi:hypothetical protein